VQLQEIKSQQEGIRAASDNSIWRQRKRHGVWSLLPGIRQFLYKQPGGRKEVKRHRSIQL